MNKQELSNLILGDAPAKRDQWFELFRDPIWKVRENLSLEALRDLTF